VLLVYLCLSFVFVLFFVVCKEGEEVGSKSLKRRESGREGKGRENETRVAWV
jgi:hypothetical protein